MTPTVKNPKLLDAAKDNERTYRALERALSRDGEWGFHYVAFTGGYYNDTDQRCLSIFVPQDCKDLTPVRDEILAFVPHLKFGANSHRKKLGIREMTCGDDGVYELSLDKEGKWYIGKWYYGSLSELHQGTLDEMLEIITKDYWRDDATDSEASETNPSSDGADSDYWREDD